MARRVPARSESIDFEVASVAARDKARREEETRGCHGRWGMALCLVLLSSRTLDGTPVLWLSPSEGGGKKRSDRRSGRQGWIAAAMKLKMGGLGEYGKW